MLDSVIEMNPFPLPQIADTVKKIRRIGLGVGGWADMLVQMGIPYDSEEALVLAEKLMKFINDESHIASRKLAKERGPFPRSEEHTSELQSPDHLVCRLLLEKKKKNNKTHPYKHKRPAKNTKRSMLARHSTALIIINHCLIWDVYSTLG